MFVLIIIESPDDTNEEDNDTTNILMYYEWLLEKGVEAGLTDSEDESTTWVQ